MRECAVLAVEDDNRLTTLAAFVAMRDTSATEDDITRELQRFVKARLLPYKYPRVVHFLADLPKTGTGKIDRQALLKV